MTRSMMRAGAASLCAVLFLAGCQDGAQFSMFEKKPATETGSGEAGKSTRIVERDVEAPDVFEANENGLWDGRPSLGGVWVAYPGIDSPERVIIRNTENGKFVIGALFNRERDFPGPKLQVSSDAASALDMLAGKPTGLSVIALRKEEVPVEPPKPEKPAEEDEKVPVTLPVPPAPVEAKPLDPITSGAAAAIDKAEGKASEAKPAATPAPAAAAKPKVSGLAKPFIQVGIFSVEANAKRTGNALRDGGIVPTILKGESRGKAFWRVVVGPASTSAERAALLKKIKEIGYTDAYFVTN